MSGEQSTRRLTRRRALRSGIALGTAAIAGCVGGPTPEEQVADAKASLEKYTDVGVALSDGYVTTAKYVRDGGLLGVPFVNYEAPPLDERRPSALFYDLSADGTYRLAGAEWFVSTDSYDSPPSLFGKTFHDAQPGHAPGQPRHYGLHVWAFSDNPEGLFAPYNPGLTPPSFLDALEPVRDALRKLRLGGVAEKNGYRNTEKCIPLGDGVYGVPFVDTDATRTAQPETPPLLLYHLTPSWSYRLLGAEWYVPAPEADSPPTLFEQSFHAPMAGHSPKTDQPDHYGLHAWLFRANPRGMFALSHPIVSCG